MTSGLIQNAVAFASVALGSLLAVGVGISHRNLCALISFAAGTLFATTAFHIVPEASEALPTAIVLLALGSGYLLFYLLSRFVFHVCPACSASHFDEQTTSRLRSVAILLVIALGVHCLMDGIGMALGEELAQKTDRSIFIAVTTHKFPEGLALTGLLIRGGFDKIRSLFYALAIEALTGAGWLFGFLALHGAGESVWFYLTLAHVGGGFIYLALHATLNESREHSSRFIIFFFLLGIIALSLIDLIPA